ncbi:MAG: TetR/AcrR family transcriptional regulator [Candidatus Sulfotelmatobacter sp.]
MLTNETRVRDGRGRPRKNTLRVRKAPGQARSQETVGVILEASARILESDGLRAFNTNAIAAKAGVSIGSLYQYFPNKDSIVLALIGSFEKAFHDTVVQAVRDGKGEGLKSRLRLVVRALVSAHYYRPRLSRVLETEEERLGSEADSAAFHESMLQLLRDHQKEVAVPVSRATERVVIAVLRALVDLGLASGASPRSTEQRALRAICGYLLYAG